MIVIVVPCHGMALHHHIMVIVVTRHGMALPELFLAWNHNQIIDLHDAGSYHSVAMCDPIVINVFH